MVQNLPALEALNVVVGLPEFGDDGVIAVDGLLALDDQILEQAPGLLQRSLWQQIEPAWPQALDQRHQLGVIFMNALYTDLRQIGCKRGFVSRSLPIDQL